MRAMVGVIVLVLGAMLGVGCKTEIPPTKTRKISGRVVRVDPTVLVVTVGAEQWELAVAPGTKIPSDLQVGSTVVVEYAMAAKAVTVRAETPRQAAPRTTTPAAPRAGAPGTPRAATPAAPPRRNKPGYELN